MVRFVLVALLATFELVGAARRLDAGLYSSQEKAQAPVRDDGRAEELSFGSQKDGAFPQLLSVLLNELDANPARASNPDRQRVVARIAEWQKKSPAALSPVGVADLGAALTRVGRLDDAIALLAPRGRDRSPDFRILANLAHVHATRGEWREALDWHVNAFDLADFPDELPGTTPAQRKWLKGVEKPHYRRWLQTHRTRIESKLKPEDVDVFPLFPARFVNERGDYQPGTLAAAERAKLPADAIPVVQQLVLWAPWDTDLYWLLAELYAAAGRLREAEVILDQCADGRQFANRRVFMAHRAAVRNAVAQLPPDKSADDPVIPADAPTASSPSPPPDPFAGLPPRMTVVLAAVGFGVVAFGMAALQVRAARRRRARA